MSNNNRSRLPNQRLSYAKKKEKDFQWAKDCIDVLSSESSDSSIQGFYEERRRMLRNYRLFNNVIDQEDLQQELNPFGLEAAEFQDEIQPYNKCYNKINVLLGEEWKRPFNFHAVLTGETGANRYIRKKTELLRNWVMQEIESDPTGKNPEIMPPSQIEKYMNTTWKEATEIASEKMLRILIKENMIKKKKNDGFKHGLISGHEHVWVGEYNGNPHVELLNPIKVFYHKSPEVEFIQDGMYAGYRDRMTIADVLDRYADDLSEKDKKDLEEYNTLGGDFGMRDDFIAKGYENRGYNTSIEYRKLKDQESYEGSYSPSSYDDVEVVHVEWRSQRKVGFLTFLDEDGREQMKMVDESFKVPSTATKSSYTTKKRLNKTKYTWQDEYNETMYELEWDWIPEIWEGTKIDDRIYVNMRPKPFQMRPYNNPWKVKLGYHGVVYNGMNAPSVSLMDRMVPFQYLYFIVTHKMKQVLAADAPPLLYINEAMISKNMTPEEVLYYQKHGIGFWDPNRLNEDPSYVNRGGEKPIQIEQRSVMQHVAQYINILNSIDDQIGEVAGVTRQREGQSSPYETVSGHQSAIIQSSHITEFLFTIHGLLWQEVLTSLLEVAIQTWGKDNKKIPYLLDDLSRGVLVIDEEQFLNCNLNVYVTDDKQELDAIDAMRRMSLELLQNGTKASEAMSLYRTTSAAEWERDMRTLENQREKAEQEMRKYEADAQQRAIELQRQLAEEQHQRNLEEIDRKGMWDVKRDQAKALGYGGDLNENGLPDVIEYQKHLDNLDLEREKMELEKETKQADRKLKEKELDSKEKIEKMKARSKKTTSS